MAAETPAKALGMAAQQFATGLRDYHFCIEAERIIDEALRNADQYKISQGHGVLLYFWCYLGKSGPPTSFSDIHCDIIAYPGSWSEARSIASSAKYFHAPSPPGFYLRSTHHYLAPGKINNPFRGIAKPIA